MNRTIAFLITMFFIMVFIAGAIAEPVIIPVQQVPEDGLAFTKGEALAKAVELFAEQGYKYSEEKYFRKAGSVLLPDDRTAWIVFIERREEEASGNLYAVLSAENGEVIELYYPENDVFTWVMMQWIDAKGQYRSQWPVDKQALFDWLFTDDDEMFDPSEAAVSSEEAVRIASAWVRKQTDIEYDETSVSYIGHYDDNRSWFSWIVSFQRNGSQVLIVYVSTETGEVENSYDIVGGVG